MNAYIVGFVGLGGAVVLATSEAEARLAAMKHGGPKINSDSPVSYVGEVPDTQLRELQHDAVKRMRCAGCEGCSYDLSDDDRRL